MQHLVQHLETNDEPRGIEVLGDDTLAHCLALTGCGWTLATSQLVCKSWRSVATREDCWERAVSRRWRLSGRNPRSCRFGFVQGERSWREVRHDPHPPIAQQHNASKGRPYRNTLCYRRCGASSTGGTEIPPARRSPRGRWRTPVALETRSGRGSSSTTSPRAGSSRPASTADSAFRAGCCCRTFAQIASSSEAAPRGST